MDYKNPADEIFEKIDLGFKSLAQTGDELDIDEASDPFDHSKDAPLRTEALKIAYDFASKQISDRKWHSLDPNQQLSTIQEIFELAELNFEYIKNAKIYIQ